MNQQDIRLQGRELLTIVRASRIKPSCGSKSRHPEFFIYLSRNQGCGNVDDFYKHSQPSYEHGKTSFGVIKVRRQGDKIPQGKVILRTNV